MNPALNSALIGATRDIFSGVLGCEVEDGKALEVAPAEDADRAEVSIVISFVGRQSGAFVFRCSHNMAITAASSMLGVAVAPGSEDLRDAVGELVNMIVGSAKTAYAATNESFKISVPTTVIGRDYSLNISTRPEAPVTVLPFTCRGEPFSIAVYQS